MDDMQVAESSSESEEQYFVGSINKRQQRRINKRQRAGPRCYDIVGDVAILHGTPPPPGDQRDSMGSAIMSEATKVKLVVARRSALATDHRCTDAFETIRGRTRSPLITTHLEFGVRYCIDLGATFFSTRMARERQRLCEQVRPGEHVFVPFAGCGPETLQLAAKTEAATVVAVDSNPAAIRCAKRGVDMLQKVAPEASSRVSVVEGDLLDVAGQLTHHSFDRIIAPRPKGEGDGDRGDGKVASDGGSEFLRILLPLLKECGECHWYDFAADWELPSCERTCLLIKRHCVDAELSCEILRVAAANRRTVAERQYRIVVDFKVQRL